MYYVQKPCHYGHRRLNKWSKLDFAAKFNQKTPRNCIQLKFYTITPNHGLRKQLIHMFFCFVRFISNIMSLMEEQVES